MERLYQSYSQWILIDKGNRHLFFKMIKKMPKYTAMKNSIIADKVILEESIIEDPDEIAEALFDHVLLHGNNKSIYSFNLPNLDLGSLLKQSDNISKGKSLGPDGIPD